MSAHVTSDMNWTLTITLVSTLMSVPEIQITAVTGAKTQMALSYVFAPVDSDWVMTWQDVWTSTSATLHHTAVVVSASTLKVPTTGQCPQGFTLEQDGRTCQDENDCEPGLHNCSEKMNKVCKNTPGSPECVCTQGYQLSTNSGNATCERIRASSTDSTNPSVIAGIAISILVVVGLTCFLLVFLLR